MTIFEVYNQARDTKMTNKYNLLEQRDLVDHPLHKSAGVSAKDLKRFESLVHALALRCRACENLTLTPTKNTNGLEIIYGGSVSWKRRPSNPRIT